MSLSFLYPTAMLFVAVIVAYFLSVDRKNIEKIQVCTGIFFYIIVVCAIMKAPFVLDSLMAIDTLIDALNRSTMKGLMECFGKIGDPGNESSGFMLSLHGFGIMIPISAFSALLIHLGILQKVAKVAGMILKIPLKLGDVLSFSAIMNIIVGISQVPLLIKNKLEDMNKSEIFALLCCGMSTIAFPVVPVYRSIINGYVNNATAHLVGSMLVSIPIALALARIVMPIVGPHTNYASASDVRSGIENGDNGESKPSVIDVTIGGMIDGGKLIVIITAIIIGVIAVIDSLDAMLRIFPGIGGEPLSFSRVLGAIFYPISLIIGIPSDSASLMAGLLGEKIIANEIIALKHLAEISVFSQETRIVGVYLLTSFGNLGTCGIAIGVYSSLCPSMRSAVSGMIIKALVVGVLSGCVTASIINFLLI